MGALASSPTALSQSDAKRRRRARSSLRVLLIDGHPRGDSLGGALADTLHRAAASRFQKCRLPRLRDLEFDPRAHVLHAINGGGQNMSRACLTGALVGAQAGLSAIPPRFIEGPRGGPKIVALAQRVAAGPSI